jgi:outer membrane lipoprotein carrier protein
VSVPDFPKGFEKLHAGDPELGDAQSAADKVLASSVAGAAAGAEAAAPAETAPDAAASLARSEKAYAGVRSMKADFVQRVTVPLLGSDQTSRGEFYQRKPDRILLKFSEPAGDIMVGDGHYFWLYYPSTDRTQVIRAKMSDAGGQVDLQQEFLSNPTARYVATLVGKEAVDGRPAQVLTLVPKGRSPYRLIKIWVDEKDALVRRFEILEENESVRRLEFRNLALNVDLPDALFAFTPPAGAQVFDQ